LGDKLSTPRSGNFAKNLEQPAGDSAPGTGAGGSTTASTTRKMRLGARTRRRSFGCPLRGKLRDSRPPSSILHSELRILKLKHTFPKTKNGPQQIIDFSFLTLSAACQMVPLNIRKTRNEIISRAPRIPVQGRAGSTL